MARRRTVEKKTNPFIISSQEIARHYALLSPPKDITLSAIHRALRPDLETFLLKKKTARELKKAKYATAEEYREWISKIDAKGVGYTILLSD